MAEFQHLFDESSQSSDSLKFTDVLVTGEWNEFTDAVEEANHVAIIYSNDDPASLDVVRRMTELTTDLRKKLSWEYDKQPCRVLGLGYGAAQRTGDTEEVVPDVIDSDNLIFHGPVMHHLAGRWQAMIQLHCTKSIDGLAQGDWYVPPDKYHLMDLRVEPCSDDDEVDDIVELLDNYVVAARRYVDSPKFLQLSADKQRQELWQFCTDLQGSLPSEFRDISVVVDCSRYYTVFDDILNRPLTEAYTDLRGTPLATRHALSGKIQGFTYPELQNIPHTQQLRQRDFTTNAGAGCMMLRNDDLQVTYYILPQSVLEVS